MFQEYKEKYCDTPYWEEAFNVAYEVKNKDLSPKEMCVVSFLKAIEYIKEELDKLAEYHLYGENARCMSPHEVYELVSNQDKDMWDSFKAGCKAMEKRI